MRSPALARLLPRPLLLLLAAATVLGVAWALVVPPWQTPDEPAHFAYAQGIGERLELPGGEGSREVFSSEQELAAERSNSLQTAGNLFARPEWSRDEYQRWQRADQKLGDSAAGDASGSGNPARSNPPLYYVYEALPYVAVSSGDIFSRLYAMRVASLLSLLVAVVATWHLVGELLGRRPLLQLVGASMVGLQPMASFISASVNPDGLLIALFAVAMLLGVRVLRHGLTVGRGVSLAGAVGAAALTKGTAYALVPALVFALVSAAAQLDSGWRPRATVLIGSALAFIVPVAAWLALARLDDRPAINQVSPGGGGGTGLETPGPLSYLWQYYLPNLPSQALLPESFPPIPAFDFSIQGLWARFGWLEVRFPEELYVLLAVVTLALLVGGAAAFLRQLSRQRLVIGAFLGLIVLSVLGGLHATEYRILQAQGTPFMQGRYLLPLLPVLGVATASALSLARGRLNVGLSGLVIGGLFTLQIFSLGLVAVRFYA